MEHFASLLVGKPLNILSVGTLFLAVHLALRFAASGIARCTRPALIASAVWVLYVAWE
jgi:hypothetical protein